CVQGLDFPLTF
nr:immunoglobulin light chain junction region [Macaca mulatta]MOV34699.1 immunoglobulin light chain junction region [Macaca mulatta]